MIPYGRQDISQADIDAVVDVLRSDFLTQGPAVPLFENSVASYVNVNYAVAVNSATSALHMACLALGLESGDLVWTSPISFVASANCALYCGAKIDFVDIDLSTFNMSIEALAQKLSYAESVGQLPKIVIPVHMAGQSCDMQAIHKLSQQYGFKIIEDASHAIGGSYKNKNIGSCEFSDISVFSFHPVKIITSGEGGMAVTNDANLHEKMVLYRSHGITRDSSLMQSHADHGAWYYEQVELGFNYRMTDIQAALGLSQMQRLASYVAKRNEIAHEYERLLEGLPIKMVVPQTDAYSSRHLYIILLSQADSNLRRKIFDFMRSKGVGVNVHYIPIHLQPFYQKLGFKYGDFPMAEDFYNSAISLPIFPTMLHTEQLYVVKELKDAFVEYSNYSC